MKRISGVMFSIVLAATACKGSEDKKSGAPASGSSAPAAGSAAVPAPPPAPTPPPSAGPPTLTAKREGAELGPYEGDKAIYLKKDADRMVLIPKNCPAFDCSLADKTAADREPIDYGKMRQACPDIHWMRIMLNDNGQPGEPAVGATKVQVVAARFGQAADIAGDWTEGGSITEITADRIAGKIDVKSGDAEAHGSFVAKICP